MSFSSIVIGTITYNVSGILQSTTGVRHAFTTRMGGVSPSHWDSLNFSTRPELGGGDSLENVKENYRRLEEATRMPLGKAVCCKQVHGNSIISARFTHQGLLSYEETPMEADGIVTDCVNIPLIVFIADCCPVLLYDPVVRCIGAVHAGWRGTAKGIVENAVKEMLRLYGSNPKNIRAAIGASIGRCCFSTGPDVPKAMKNYLGSDAEAFVRRSANADDTFFVDLKGLNRFQLMRMGVPNKQIDIHPDCTACHPERYWSHRKMGSLRGSMIAVISMCDVS